MQTILVTGASGFVGSTLLAMAKRGELDPPQRFEALAPGVDLRDSGAIKAALDGIACDAVIHLAAISFVPESVERPSETYEINLHGTINLIQALKARRFTGGFIYVSSGEVYGTVPPEELPITEERIPRPRNPYAASKLAAEAYCYQAAVAGGMRVLIARPFNHIGPGQSDRFVLPAMAKQLREIKQGRRAAVIETGNIDVTRDFSDVRDVLRAYLAILASGRAGETYNVCSGVERNVGDVLRQMLEITGIKASMQVTEEKRRPHEQRRHYGSNRKLCDDTGWRPRMAFEQSLRDLLASWELI
jgi:GDP-4-dehydro-6-deoxy-D-mannose reductase